jgi:hypothetical protein
MYSSGRNTGISGVRGVHGEANELIVLVLSFKFVMLDTDGSLLPVFLPIDSKN